MNTFHIINTYDEFWYRTRACTGVQWFAYGKKIEGDFLLLKEGTKVVEGNTGRSFLTRKKLSVKIIDLPTETGNGTLADFVQKVYRKESDVITVCDNNTILRACTDLPKNPEGWVVPYECMYCTVESKLNETCSNIKTEVVFVLNAADLAPVNVGRSYTSFERDVFLEYRTIWLTQPKDDASLLTPYDVSKALSQYYSENVVKVLGESLGLRKRS